MVHSGEGGDSDDSAHLPSINTKTNEMADMQDMYRRTLAASWMSRSCDLPADKLIEDLFAGSSCWNNDSHNAVLGGDEGDHHQNTLLGGETAERQTRSGKRLSSGFERRPKSTSSFHSNGSPKPSSSLSTLESSHKDGDMDHPLYDGKGRSWKSRNAEHERSEFSVREDLRSWEVTPKE